MDLYWSAQHTASLQLHSVPELACMWGPVSMSAPGVGNVIRKKVLRVNPRRSTGAKKMYRHKEDVRAQTRSTGTKKIHRRP